MNTQDHKQALPPGFRLGNYRVVRVLGAGGFGVTYLCEHGGLGVTVAVKEYMPNDIAVRSGNAVVPKSAADREGYQWGLSRFLDEARTLARFEHRNVVRVRDYFEANGTAYIVMDYEDGEPLDRVLERKGTLTEAQIKRVLLPIVEGLRQVHAAGFLHRDVKPANIFIRRSDESPVLLDFGSARQALSSRSRSVTAIASAGYSPPEQYESGGEQGPWTDIYALSALCYRAITGMVPVEATRRQGRLLRGEDDPLARLVEIANGRCSHTFLTAVDRGLRVVEGERPQSLDSWEDEIEGRARGNHSPAKSPETDALLSPEVLVLGARLAGFFIEGGARKFEDYAEHMAEALGDSFSAYRPHLRQFYEAVRHDPNFADWRDEMTPLAELDAIGNSGTEMLLADIVRLREAAERGDAVAQFRLGIYHQGDGGAQDHRQAVRWYRKAAEQGSAAAQNNLGAMYSNGKGVPKDDQQAVQWYRKAAEQGSAAAQHNLGLMYKSGEGVAQDHGQAVRWYRKAAEQGDAAAQNNLGAMYSNGNGVPKDDSQALQWCRKAAEQEHAGAQNNLGVMYSNGKGVPKDDQQAVQWYRKAAEQGHAKAQSNLGWMYSNGYGVRKSNRQAVRWYRKAAEQGHANAQSNLGWMYSNGNGVLKSNRLAARWYRKAAEQGHANAQNNLGLSYANGHGVRKDDQQAVLWYRKAAEQGLSVAQRNLGAMYSNGNGVPKDLVEAYAWFSLAAAQGDLDAERYRTNISSRAWWSWAARMTSSQIAEAQRLSRELAAAIEAGKTQ